MQAGISGRVSAELRSDAVKMVFVKEESKENPIKPETWKINQEEPESLRIKHEEPETWKINQEEPESLRIKLEEPESLRIKQEEQGGWCLFFIQLYPYEN